VEPFAQEICRGNERPLLRYYSRALRPLLFIPGPGNVRELENVIRALLVLLRRANAIARYLAFPVRYDWARSSVT